MNKGDRTRQAILKRASLLASRIGLEALSIGRLADELDLSKSGLFAHFQSKEALAVQVIEFAAADFVEQVVKPGLRAPRGEARLRALFERWLEWSRSRAAKGGCVFVSLAAELDDRPGPARDRLAQSQREWLGVLAGCFQVAVDQGEFRKEADAAQFAQDLYGVCLSLHHSRRLLDDAKAEIRARRAFETLLAAARTPGAHRSKENG
jgi:AcrR family transcriptional regulator